MGDDVADTPYPIDLTASLRLVGETREAIDVLVARERAAAANADKWSATLSFLPTMKPRVSWFRHEGNIQDTGGNFLDVDKQNAFGGTGVELSVNPADALFNTLAARRRADARHADIAVASQETLLEAAYRYYELVLATLHLRIHEEAGRHADELARIEQARLDQGTGLKLDVLRARARRAEMRGLIAAARGAVGIASSRLVELLQLDGRMKLSPASEELALVEFVAGDADLAGLVERARSSRPELESLEHVEKALAAEETRTGFGWLFPRVRGGISYGDFGATLSHKDVEEQETYYVGLELELDVNRYTQWKSATHQRRAVALGRTGLENRIVADVVGAFESVHASREQVAATREQVTSAEEALAIAESRRENGVGLLIDVLDAQEALVRARTALTGAMVGHNRSQYDLLRAVGGP